MSVVVVSPGPTKTGFGGGGPSGLMGVVTRVLKHPPLLKRADQAAEGIVWAATAPEPAHTSGARYMHHKQLTLKGADARSAQGPTQHPTLAEISVARWRAPKARSGSLDGRPGAKPGVTQARALARPANLHSTGLRKEQT